MISYKPFYETLFRRNFTEYQLIHHHGISAVSYTHLDVYKRQLLSLFWEQALALQQRYSIPLRLAWAAVLQVSQVSEGKLPHSESWHLSVLWL